MAERHDDMSDAVLAEDLPKVGHHTEQRQGAVRRGVAERRVVDDTHRAQAVLRVVLEEPRQTGPDRVRPDHDGVAQQPALSPLSTDTSGDESPSGDQRQTSFHWSERKESCFWAEGHLKILLTPRPPLDEVYWVRTVTVAEGTLRRPPASTVLSW